MDTIGKPGTTTVKTINPTDEMALETMLITMQEIARRLCGQDMEVVLAAAPSQMDTEHPERIKTMVITTPGTNLEVAGRTLYFCLGAVQTMAMDNSPIVEPTRQ